MRKSIKSGKIMVMTERFEVYKYNGGKKKKNNTDIRGKKKTFRFGRDMPEVMPEIAKTCPGAAQTGQREKRARGTILVGLMSKTVKMALVRKRKSKVTSDHKTKVNKKE